MKIDWVATYVAWIFGGRFPILYCVLFNSQSSDRKTSCCCWLIWGPTQKELNLTATAMLVDDENNLKYYLSHISPSEWLKHKKMEKEDNIFAMKSISIIFSFGRCISSSKRHHHHSREKRMFCSMYQHQHGPTAKIQTSHHRREYSIASCADGMKFVVQLHVLSDEGR